MNLLSGVFTPFQKHHQLVRAIRGLGFCDIKNGPWIAGGAVRRILLNKVEILGDIDIFGKKHQLNRIEESFENRSDIEILKKTVCSLNYNLTYKNHHLLNTTKVQLIQRTHESVEELLETFDFTICMAVTDGWNWVADERFFSDNDEMKLALNDDNKKRYSLKRLAKYCGYGYTPKPNVFGIMAGLNGEFEESLDEKCQFITSSGEDYD